VGLLEFFNWVRIGYVIRGYIVEDGSILVGDGLKKAEKTHVLHWLQY
jgi:hypothetical protein